MTGASRQKALQEFTEYFVRNYPGPHTIISNPNWHAPQIFRAAERALADYITLAQQAAYERAAQECDGFGVEPDAGDYARGMKDCADQLADAIRSLGSASALELALREEWIKGFELAHELQPCGHSRGDCRDPNYKPGDEFCESQCIGCQREAKLKAALELALAQDLRARIAALREQPQEKD